MVPRAETTRTTEHRLMVPSAACVPLISDSNRFLERQPVEPWDHLVDLLQNFDGRAMSSIWPKIDALPVVANRSDRRTLGDFSSLAFPTIPALSQRAFEVLHGALAADGEFLPITV